MEKTNIEWITYKIISWFDVIEDTISTKEVYDIFDWILDLYYYNWWKIEYLTLRKFLKYWYERLDITNLIQKFTVLVVAYNSEWKLIWFIRWFWDWYKSFYIEDIILDKDYRWQWIAQIMMKQLILFIWKNYSYKSILVSPNNKAENFFKKEWFTISKRSLFEYLLKTPEYYMGTFLFKD